MNFSHLQYLPISASFFAILLGLLLLLVVLIRLGALRYAWLSLGLRPATVVLLLCASLFGSYFNIPVAQLPGRQVLAGHEVTYFGMRYMVPVIVEWPGTVIAVNVGGALIPGLTSVYLYVRHRLFLRGALAVICVAAVCHWLAHPIPGLGIALPVFVPAAVTAFIALLLSRRRAAPIAYIGGSLGTLVGADLLNLGRFQSLGAPIASIGGAGTFDGIFLVGVLAVLLASIFRA